MEFGLGLAVAVLVGAICLLVGTRIASMHVSLSEILIISVVSGLFTMIPKVGGPFGAVVMLVMLAKWSDADFWPDTVANVFVAQLSAFLAMHFLTPVLLNLVQ